MQAWLPEMLEGPSGLRKSLDPHNPHEQTSAISLDGSEKTYYFAVLCIPGVLLIVLTFSRDTDAKTTQLL